jgi:hypothetical protein
LTRLTRLIDVVLMEPHEQDGTRPDGPRPQQPAAPPHQPPHVHVPPPSGQWVVPPGYPAPIAYYAIPTPIVTPGPAAAENPTKLSSWGLTCSIGGFALPLLGLVFAVLDGLFWFLGWLLAWLGPISALLGLVLSAVAMAGRHARRGQAVAGLVVGIVAVVFWLFFLLIGFATRT